MTLDPKDVPWPETAHLENRYNFPPEELLKYAGQYVAWNWESTRIIDSAADIDSLYDQLTAAGIDTNRVVFEYIEEA